MKNYSKVVLGVILIVLGVVFLGNNYNWFSIDVSFRHIAKWWPLLLVVGGIGVFLNPDRRLANPLTVLAISFAIPLALFAAANDGVERVERSFKLDAFTDENEPDRNESYGSDEDSYNPKSSTSNQRKVQNFNIENQLGIERAKLDFGGGAAEFFLETTKDNLFEAKTVLTKGSYKLESDKSGSNVEVDFDMIDSDTRHVNVNDDIDFDNDVYIKLNPAVLWDIRLGIGAGDLDFDFSKFRVERIKVETGVAAIKIKLSDLLKEVEVDVKSGVAKVNIEVPKGVGCRIDLSGAMNTKNFSGFNKIDNDRWETSNFDSAKKKIYIDLDSGLTSLNISRY
ncbi:MAG: hypothetical protein ACJAZY_001421 [Spirosomataceae bacterium]|jgi:hypothetical protein